MEQNNNNKIKKKNSFLLIKTPFIKQIIFASLTMIFFFFLWLKYLDIYTLHNRYITLPDFYGVHVHVLDSVTEELDLRYIVIDSAFHKNVDKGTILEQDPIAGTKVKKNRRIYFTINALSLTKIGDKIDST